MKGLFCSRCRAKNNEEYRAVLKKRQVGVCLCILVSVVLMGIVLFLCLCTQTGFTEYRLGYLLGLGGGLALGGVIALVRIRRMLADEEKLKEARLKETDERELEVDSLALLATGKILLLVLYVLMFVAGLIENEGLLVVCMGLIAVFLLGYAAFRKYYGAKL